MDDHQEIYDLMKEGKSFEEAYDATRGVKKERTPKEQKEEQILPTFPPRKAEKKVKMARAGGVISSASKRADGCAQRGKTRGRIM